MPPVGPVKPTVGPQKWTVNVAAVAVELEPGQQLFAANRLSGAGFFKLPEARMRCAIKSPVMPEHTLRKHQIIDEHPARVILAIAVGVFKDDDSPQLLLR